MKTAVTLCLVGLFAALPAFAAETIRCPIILKSFVALEDRDASQNWLLGGPRQTFVLKGGRVFIGRLSEESIHPSSEVKPIPHIERKNDDKMFYQVWNLEGAEFDNSMLICDYVGTDNYLIYALEPKVKKCIELVPVGKSNGDPTRVECE